MEREIFIKKIKPEITEGRILQIEDDIEKKEEDTGKAAKDAENRINQGL